MRLILGHDSVNSAFEAAYEKYADLLYRVALSHMGDNDGAQDAVHDVFIKFINSPPKLTDEEHERAFLIRATINRCRDLLRRHKVRAYIPFDELGDLPDTTEAQAIDAKSGAENIIRLVSSLDEKYRSVIVLHCLEEIPVEKTAKILGLSESAVKMRLSRGRDMLKNLMNKEGYNVQ